MKFYSLQRRWVILKKRLDMSNTKKILFNNSNKTGWSLCIGAGTSINLFPDWNELISSLIENVGDKDSECCSALEKFSLDALLQAGYELKNIGDDEYAKLLSNLLFKNAKKIMSSNEFKDFTKVLGIETSHKVSGPVWSRFISIRENYMKNTSAYSIAKIIAEIIDDERRPSEILSFNAEILLFSLINSFIIEIYSKRDDVKLHSVKKHVDIVNRSISNIYKDRIAYILCHGVLPVPSAKNSILTATDKLVFRETEYLNLANNMYSWQASMFLHVSSIRPILFVGVSLSDPNMRRWLSWIHNNREREVEHIYKTKMDSTTHYWIDKKPESETDMKWIEACVYHLGVRVIWIEKWSQVDECIRNMLGL